MSYSVMSSLRQLADNRGCTIIFNIDQPRLYIYTMFDKLHLLSCFGQTVYHGKAQHALRYFANLGLICESHNNPADFFLDIIMENSDSGEVLQNSGRDNLAMKFDNDRRGDIVTSFKSDQIVVSYPNSDHDEEEVIDKKNLPKMFQDSAEALQMLSECDQILSLSQNYKLEQISPKNFRDLFCFGPSILVMLKRLSPPPPPPMLTCYFLLVTLFFYEFASNLIIKCRYYKIMLTFY